MSTYYSLLSPDSYGTYNRKLAKLTSLNLAVYWAEILDIIPQVIKKKKFTEEGFFKLDRKYIEERTCITLEDQLNFDSILITMGVMIKSPEDTDILKVDLEKMTAILVNSDVTNLDLPKGKLKPTRAEAAANKLAGIVISMKKLLSEQDPELRIKYENWIDSVYSRGKFLTKAKIQMFESEINSYAKDKQTKLGLLDVSILTGYDVAEWVINKYEYSNKSKPQQLAPQVTTTSTSDKYVF